MADVFLSYDRDDRPKAARLASLLQACSWTVWWDYQHLRGMDLELTVEKELAAARCALVLWSSKSIRSNFVCADAERAKARGVLLPVLIEAVTPPLGFRLDRTWNLVRWDWDQHDARFKELAEQIERLVAPSTGPAAHIAGKTADSQQLPSASATAKHASDNIFVCYRRDDSQDASGRLYDRLVSAYGSERVFMDIDSVPLGVDFVDHINEQLAGCRAVIVMIGRHWLTIVNRHNQRRLDLENDHVRAEIAVALQQKIPVIPALVQGAEMPQPEDLPENIRPLARRNGTALTATRWHADVERLIKELDRVIAPGISFNKRVAIRPVVGSGTARMGASGLTAKPSADLIVHNAGDPFHLVAHARLLHVSDGYEWEHTDQWEYEPRLLKGGNGKTWYHIATVDPAPDVGRESVVGVRAEHMVVIRRWETKEGQEKQPLWFDVEWKLYNDLENTLYHIDTVATRITLKETPMRGFDVALL